MSNLMFDMNTFDFAAFIDKYQLENNDEMINKIVMAFSDLLCAYTFSAEELSYANCDELTQRWGIYFNKMSRLQWMN